MRRLTLFLVLVWLTVPCQVAAQEDPRLVVRRTYNWVLEWYVGKYKRGYQLVSDKQYYASLKQHRHDFTDSLYQLLIGIETATAERRAVGRSDFWDNCPLTFTQTHILFDYPAIGQTQRVGEALIVPVSSMASFRGKRPIEWTVEFQQENMKWGISNLYFSKNQINLKEEITRSLAR